MSDDFGGMLIALLPNLRRFAISLCRSRDVADDLVQVTCERALANRASFEPGTRFDAWMFRILRNAWIDQTRRLKTQGTVIDIEAAHTLIGDEGEKSTGNRLMLSATLKAIDALPEDQREIILLTCVEEMSYKETAEVLDVPIGTVMSRLARARKKVAEELGIKKGINGSPDRFDDEEETSE